MKTLFFNKKAVALFNCTIGMEQKTAIRIHIYNLVQKELVYETNFVICQNELSLEDINEVTFDNNILTLVSNNGKTIVTNYYNHKVIKNNSIKLFSSFKIKEYLHKINQIIKAPQLNNFF